MLGGRRFFADSEISAMKVMKELSLVAEFHFISRLGSKKRGWLQ